ncbi:response regulator [uncultured Chitinophaga sp.]|uniref:hybrid sensor histidine kinase/response regulator n=1 Tax=uncultured Chitinophaga sp. TaxID=339340 RepID=UPI0025FE4508|nr:response regulator [uncultured Chitinophaga sp.]
MILIVDDKPENILSLKKTLELYQFQVDSANSGEEALKKILKTSYTLIILDVQMPSMDGFEVAEALSGYSKARDIPIIFLSAVNKDKKFITKGYDSGGVDYITKPVDPDILIMKVKSFYRMYQQTQELSLVQQELREEVEVRKKAQQALDKKVKELHTILESLPQIAFTATADGRIEYANQHWFRYSPNMSVMPQTAAGESSLDEDLQLAFRSGRPLEKETYIKDLHEGQYRCHLLKVTPMQEDDETLKWIGTFTDISHQKQANEILESKVRERTEELWQINKSLEESNHDLQQFASVASHDLKEPLRKIHLFGAMLRDKFPDDDEAIKPFLNRIVYSSNRMTRLINDLLNFSRLSASSDFEKTDVNLLLDEILSDLELAIQEKNARFHVSKIPHIEVVPGQIRQVFQNIISNALKFSKADVAPEITIHAETIATFDVNAAADPDGKFCRISISDNGIGFDEQYLPKIFTIFQRLHTMDRYEGTGIGLAIAKKVIERHDGVLTAKSKLNEGSAFIFVLPLTQPENKKQQAKELAGKFS